MRPERIGGQPDGGGGVGARERLGQTIRHLTSLMKLVRLHDGLENVVFAEQIPAFQEHLRGVFESERALHVEARDGLILANKRIVKGVGMMKYEMLEYGPGPMGNEEAESFMEAMRHFMTRPVGDEKREVNAQRCRDFLGRVGLGDMMITSYAIDEEKLRSKGLAENSAQWLAACWLRTFNRLQDEVTRINAGQGDVSLLVSISEELGRIGERMYWRAGVDPQTGKTHEKLAIGKQSQELSTGKAAKARREKASENEPDWWDHARIRAREIRQSRPDLSRSRIAELIAEEVRRSERQVRDVIKPVC